MFACNLHPFKQCTYLNKESLQLQCPQCLFPQNVQNQLSKSSLFNSPLQENNELIDIDEVAYMAKSVLQADDQQQQISEQFAFYQQTITQNIKQFQQQSHEIIDQIFQKIQDSVVSYLQQNMRKTPVSEKNIAAIIEEINSPNVEMPQYIQSISQLHDALRTIKQSQLPFQEINQIKHQLDDHLNNLLQNLNRLSETSEFNFINKQTDTFQHHKQSFTSSNKLISTINRTFAKDTIESITKKEIKCSLKTDYKLTCVLAFESQVVIGTTCGKLVTYDTSSWDNLQTINAHEGMVKVLAKFQNDSSILASGGIDRKITIWSQTNQIIKLHDLIAHHNMILDIKIARKGSQNLLISSSSDNTVRLWDYSEGKHLVSYSGHKSDVFSIAYSEKYKCVVSSSQDKTIRIWDAEQFKVCRPLKRLTGHTDSVMSVIILSEDERILSCSLDQTMRMWDIPNGQLMRTIQCGQHMRCLSQFSSGIAILISQDNSIKLWDYNIKTCVHTLQGLKKISNFDIYDQEIYAVEDQNLNKFY